MKKFKLQNVKKEELDSTKKMVVKNSKVQEGSTIQIDSKQQKKSQIQKQMQILHGKINETQKNIKQTQKMLDIDLFLKKQKQKSKEYASKLNQEYQHKKKQRESTLYNRNSTKQIQKPISLLKNIIPIRILSGIRIITEENRIKKWIVQGHHDNLNKLLEHNTLKELFNDQELKIEEEKCLKSKGEHSWKNIREISQNSTETQIFPMKIQENQLQPSDFGELIMSALTLMPQRLSQYLFEQKEKHKTQDYFILCRFYPGGERKSVITNSCIEVRQYVHKFVNINSRHSNGVTFWSSIIQKSIKKLYFQEIFPTTIMEMISAIYGIEPQVMEFKNKSINRQTFDNVLQFLKNQDQKALIGFYNDQSMCPNRIFPLETITRPVVKPSKKGKKEQKIQQEQIMYTILNPYSKFGQKSMIKTKLKYNELFAQFNKLIILREYPIDWIGLRIFAQFFSNGPLNSTNTEWIKNNQYSFNMAKEASVRIIMRRRWGTYLQKTDMEQQQAEKLIFGFAIFKSISGETEINSMKLDSLITKAKSNDENGCIFNGILPKNTYIIVPYTNLISKQYTQSFIFDIITQKQELLSLNKSKINQFFYENIQANDNKIIQKLQLKVRYEKPRYEKIILPLLNYQKRQNRKNKMTAMNMTDQQQKEILIPGLLKKFITREPLQSEQNLQQNPKSKKKDENQYKSQQQIQLQQLQRQEGLKILLGYDVLMDQDINHGQMLSIIEETSDQIDLGNYQLGQEGLLGVMETLLNVPRLTKIDLSNNQLNDSAITYLCYYLEKGRRNQLRTLNLKGNNSITKTGKRALSGLTNIFKDLQIIV